MKVPFKIILVVAYGKYNLEIGNSNMPKSLPGWDLPSDFLDNFKPFTIGDGPEENILLMGRKTFEALPEKFRPLSKRFTAVVTRNKDYRHDHPSVKIFHSVHEVIMYTQGIGRDKIFILGGEQIYREVISLFDEFISSLNCDLEIRATEVDGQFPGADAYFPKMNLSGWKKELVKGYRRGPIVPGEKKENSHDFEVVSYTL